jgi:catechol 2,3-dioxygenase
MDETRVTALRGVELSVFDLKKSAAFYREVWGLEEVAQEGGSLYLRGTATEHHILTLHEAPRAGLAAIDFAARDRRTVDALHAKTRGLGADIVGAPQVLPAVAGGGYGFSVRTPEGQVLNISCAVTRHEHEWTDRSKPLKLSHVVLNVEDLEKQNSFFCDVLGFRLSDRTERMDFVRCSSDHHSIALARGHGAGLNHMAYEVADFDGLMRGAGRLKQNGYNVEWGVGRHGPGNNIFSYFVEPNGFVTEYTAEVEHIDEAAHIPGTPEYWNQVMKGNPDRWGMADPSKRLRAAMSGKIVEENNLRCEDIISRRMAS